MPNELARFAVFGADALREGLWGPGPGTCHSANECCADVSDKARHSRFLRRLLPITNRGLRAAIIRVLGENRSRSTHATKLGLAVRHSHAKKSRGACLTRPVPRLQRSTENPIN